jgi:endo-1,4-beta-xylanase
MNISIPRRRCLAVLIAFLLSAPQAYGQSDTIETNVPHLKEVFANDFFIGCLLSYPHIGFPDDPPVPGQGSIIALHGGDLIKYHMNSMSPGNNMKPQYTVNIGASAATYSAASAGAERDSVDVHPVIQFNGNLSAQLNWAHRQGFTFRGHTLVWHSQTPGTAFFRSGYTDTGTRLTKEQMTERMRNYIREVVRLLHEGWPGLLSAVDVVNEAVSDNGTFRTSGNEWYTTFGDNSYVLKAFQFTREAAIEYGETQMKLYYNDYNTHLPAKANGIVSLIHPIFQAGYLDGIGMQDHDQYNSPTAAQWIASYDKFDTVCTEMSVTELDVNPGGSLTADVLARQANQYAALVKCFVGRSYRSGRGKLVSVSKDGLNDQLAFVANASLWTNLNKCKPAFYSAVNVGICYNTLDSLIAYADALQESHYTSGSWSNLVGALNAAKTARDQDYSYTVPADTALMTAYDNLSAAIGGLVVSVARSESQPAVFQLLQNYPNPFNPSTRIGYSVPHTSRVVLGVYDLLGRKVATLFDGIRSPGTYVEIFNASGLAGGVYLYRIHAEGFAEARKLVLAR